MSYATSVPGHRSRTESPILLRVVVHLVYINNINKLSACAMPFADVAFQSHQFSETRPGLIQHVLTVLGFVFWALLLPWPPPSSRSLRLCPWASILLYGPLNVCLDLLPTAHVFTAQGGTRRPVLTSIFSPCAAKEVAEEYLRHPLSPQSKLPSHFSSISL